MKHAASILKVEILKVNTRAAHSAKIMISITGLQGITSQKTAICTVIAITIFSLTRLSEV
jgi:hypothetical protein